MPNDSFNVKKSFVSNVKNSLYKKITANDP